MELHYLSRKILHEPLDFHNSELNGYILIGGFADMQSVLSIAESYKGRADDLVEITIGNSDIAYEYTFPILFLYRHSLELFLKSIYPNFKRQHSFENLIDNLKAIAQNKIPEEILNELVARINEFKEIDNRSTRFRYGNQLGEEFLVHLNQLRQTFNEMVTIIKTLNS